MSRRDLAPDTTDHDAPRADPATPNAPEPHALRASHEDRDAVVEQLRVAAGDGRLTAEELDDRLGTALTARTYGELAVLVQDLPAAAGTVLRPGSPPHPVPVRDVLGGEPTPEVVRLQARHSSLARTGPWVVPLRMEVEAKSANAVIDFTRAVVSHPVLDLVLSLHSSNLRLVVPPGVVVAVDDLAVHSSSVQQRTGRPTDAPVTLLVRVSGGARSSNIAVRAPREGFWTRRRKRRAARRALTA
jgi:hypothetical protein